MKRPTSKASSARRTASVAHKDRRSPSSRAARAAERRRAILEAALDEFSTRGFAAARLEDVAKRAGVAKGTIYLHFKDKEALFRDLVRTSLVPLIGNIPVPQGEISVRVLLEAFADTFVREVLNTRRGDIIRLVSAEGRRFPSLAEFHYHEVIERAVASMQRLIAFGIARGEIHNEELQRFPQLIVAPALMALLWQGLFGRFAPLDAAAMLRTHIDLILQTPQRRA